MNRAAAFAAGAITGAVAALLFLAYGPRPTPPPPSTLYSGREDYS